MPITSTARSEPTRTAMAFVDAGYLIAAARKLRGLEGPLRIDGSRMQGWFEWILGSSARLLRVYIYDGQLPPDHPEYADQRAAFDVLGAEFGIRLRLGHMTERQAGTGRARYEQKGVDTLLVLDLVRLAQMRAFDVAMILAGDRDIAEAMRVIADDYARLVAHYSVEGSEPAKELRQVADWWAVLEATHIDRMVVPR